MSPILEASPGVGSATLLKRLYAPNPLKVLPLSRSDIALFPLFLSLGGFLHTRIPFDPVVYARLQVLGFSSVWQLAALPRVTRACVCAPVRLGPPVFVFVTSRRSCDLGLVFVLAYPWPVANAEGDPILVAFFRLVWFTNQRDEI